VRWQGIHSTRKFGVTVNLEGGVGNQLFQYAAGLALAKQLECSLTINVSRVEKNRHGGKCITDFGLESNCRVESVKNSPKIDNRLSRAVRLQLHPMLTSHKGFFSRHSGFDEVLLRMPKGTQLNGYFQTFRYQELLAANQLDLRDLKLKSPSIDFSSLELQANRVLPVVLHIRRGDYLSLTEEFGLLSSKYYLEALRRMNAEFPEKEIWVYSDDFKTAKNVLDELGHGFNFRFMEETARMPAPEVLLLMSMGAAHIIANSSFSWWGASLSRSTKAVIAPDPWFRSRPTPEELIPKDWQTQKAQWV
jgi:hypothetical protein